MRSDKGKAFVLRRSGKSYREIAAELGVAQSTLSNWFAGVDFSTAIKAELTKKANKQSAKRLIDLNRVRGIALSVHYEQAAKEAIKEMEAWRHVPLFTTGLGIYWGEGNQASRNQIRVANTDAKMLKVFAAFLEEICGVKKENMRLALFIYPNLSEWSCKKYWKKELGIDTFHKTQILPSLSELKHLKYGTCMLVVSNTYLKRKFDAWIDHLPEMVLNTVPKKTKRGHG